MPRYTYFSSLTSEVKKGKTRGFRSVLFLAAIPILILIARIAEASLESVRTIYISKGMPTSPHMSVSSRPVSG